ncbi:carboxymuconolactone decarboxylase family protein [Youngiibacter fragilis]|uniref:carboxymuconolactone decarboxylase family protein n=1 Tax=Youngiibacter fragilis TaxID=1408819 RepID=UPI00041511F6|nr:carboxymuconolactone decarboxylase family protein [Youngiibacter fragilis]
MKKQTAGRDALGEFAPKFAELKDDVLFGEVWSREAELSTRERSIITVTALVTKGIFDGSLKYHITNAMNHGVSADEMAEIITHIAFYAGWPNAWAAFAIAREVYAG